MGATMNLEQPAHAAEREKHLFKIPPKLAASSGTKTLTMVVLLGSEELLATQRAKNNPVVLSYELVKESIRKIDGKSVSTSDGSVDAAWERLHPAVRTLAAQAYVKLHTPEREEAEAFLASHEIQVG